MNDSASKLKGLLWLVTACVLGAMFAFGISPLSRIIPWSWEKSLANVIPEPMEQTCNDNQQTKLLLDKLVKRIYPINTDDDLFSIEVHVVNSKVVNAYATLGGKIYVNSALLEQAQSPEELAGILAHEIEHISHRHILEGLIVRLMTVEGVSMIFSGSSSGTQLASYFLNMSFTSSQEAVADAGGLLRLQQAHIDNQGFKHFFERMEKSGIASILISDHPANQDRIAMVEKFNNKDTQPIMTQEEWSVLQNSCGKIND